MSRCPLLIAAGAFLVAPAFAQDGAKDKTIRVFFEPCETQALNHAIVAALTKPPFLLLTRITAEALVVTIPDRISIDRKSGGATWSYTVQFRRNGDSLGQSVESCDEKDLTECTDQLASDVKSAAGMGP